MTVDSNDHIFAGTGFGGVYISTDNGENWELYNSGLVNASCYAFAKDSNNRLFVATYCGVYTSIDGGSNWELSGLIDVPINSIKINNEDYIFVGSLGRGVYLSTDGGGNWIEKNTYLTDPTVSSLVINSEGDIFVGTYSGGVFISTDNGDEWTQINSGFTNMEIRSLVIDSSDNIFAGNFFGVYKSTNNGNSWTKMGLDEVVSDFAINSQNHLFAADFGGNIYKSTDGGVSWNQKYIAPYVQSILINSSDYIFAGTSSQGVYYSKDNGENWTPINSGLNTLDVKALSFNSYDELIAGTERGGVYRSLNPSSTEEINNNPANFILSQNYPNPFNPSTNIQYAIGSKQFVQLKVYDVLGNEIATLVNEEKSPGTYEVQFNVAQDSRPAIGSGIYFYQLIAGDFVQSKKMILIK